MIEVSHLTYTYPNADRPALDDISFRVEPGECFGIVGANGVGKSSLGYTLMGLIPHFFHGTIRGDVWIDGVNAPDATLAEMSRHISIVLQNPANQLSGTKLTVAEEMAFGLENFGVSRSEMHNRIRETAAALGITNILQRNPFELSGGQMQRVAIASVMVLRPKVIVLDEPTSQLDPGGTRDVFAAVDVLRKQGVTVVCIEHKAELLAAHCTRIGVIQHGKLVRVGTPSEVFGNPALSQFGVSPPRATLAYQAVVRAANELDTGAAELDQPLPTTRTETIERLRAYELEHRR